MHESSKIGFISRAKSILLVAGAGRRDSSILVLVAARSVMDESNSNAQRRPKLKTIAVLPIAQPSRHPRKREARGFANSSAETAALRNSWSARFNRNKGV